eukprot:1195446-Prorocentrum_minimum.AAC.4
MTNDITVDGHVATRILRYGYHERTGLTVPEGFTKRSLAQPCCPKRYAQSDSDPPLYWDLSTCTCPAPHSPLHLRWVDPREEA